MAKFPRISSILAIVIAISSEVNSFTKYGRGCQDIGCLPNEVCTMAQDSCNLGQRDGKECGTYPTCKRTGAAKPAGSNLKPTASDNSFYSQPSNPTSNTNFNQNSNGYNSNQQWQNNNPYPPQNTNTIFGSRQNQQPQIDSNIPIFPFNHPTSSPPAQQFPQANHPDVMPKIPQNFPGPQNPYQPPYVFGNQPSLYNPQATTREPSLLEQFLYNKQDRPRSSKSSGRVHNLINFTTLSVTISYMFTTVFIVLQA